MSARSSNRQLLLQALFSWMQRDLAPSESRRLVSHAVLHAVSHFSTSERHGGIKEVLDERLRS